jgi:hypothetical protein
MRQTAQDNPVNVKALRERLRKMGDVELRTFGRAASDSIELSEAQAEWRRRQEVKSKRHREVPRHTFIAVTEITEDGSQASILAKTSTISRKGCYVETATPSPVGTSMRLVISREQGAFATKGEVIYVHEGKGMGVVFVDVSPDQVKTLLSWLPGN